MTGSQAPSGAESKLSSEATLFRKLMIVSLTLGMVVIFCLGASVWHECQSMLAARQWVLHTHELRSALILALSDMKDAETGQRGYVLTGDESYLEPYQSALKHIHARMKLLNRLAHENPKQLKTLAHAESIIEEKISELAETVSLRKIAGFETTLALVKTGRGKHLMDDLTDCVQGMDREEERLLQPRVEALNNETDTFLSTLVVSGSAIVLLLFAFAYFLKRYLRDLTEAQTKVAEQKVLFAAVLNSLSDAVMVADSTGKFLVVNPAASKITGIHNHSASPENWTEAYGCFHADGVTPYEAEQLPLVRAMRGELIHDEEIIMKNASLNSPVWISVSGAPLSGDTGVNGAGVVVFRDVTMRKAAERRISEFISTVSHELRTPLTSIKGALRILEGGLAGELSARASSLIKIASTETERLIKLVNDILDLRKIEEGSLELKLASIQLSTMIERAVHSVQGLASGNETVLQRELSSQPTILCDEDRIIQVIVNLLSNAIKFSPNGSVVKIASTNTNSGRVRFSVSDIGPGIAEADLQKLFGRFQQIDSSDTRQIGGSGLGLAISKAIVEQHGGQIGVESEVGKGSTFWFELPVKQVNLSSIDTELSAAFLHPLLVIEDDQHLIELLANLLANEGFSVIPALTIAEANEKLAQTKPEAILLDINLPDGNGLTWLQNFRESAATSENPIPVIVMTGGTTNESDGTKPLLIYDWLSKPFSLKALSNLLRHAVREKSDAAATVLVVEDNELTRELLVGQLSALGAVCIEAASGELAIEIVRREHPDLIVLDIGLPGCNGYEVVEALREDTSRSTPLIVYTSSDLTNEDKRMLTLGMSKHFTKSKTSDEQLVQAVRDLLNGLLGPGDGG